MEKMTYRLRFPLLAMGFLALLAAMWAGLVRLGWGWLVLRPALPMAHGPLMVGGFLGTVIGLERAVALTATFTAKRSYRWTYISPLLTGLGALVLIAGLPDSIGPWLITLGSLSLVLVFGLILRIQLARYTVTMASGAVLWLVGNGLWLFGWPLYVVVSWWSGFLILTIAGERLELGRILRLSRSVQMINSLIISLLVVGLITTLFNLDVGMQLVGVGMVTIALWLFRYDVARYTVRKAGLARFTAICLLAGYAWLGLAGILSGLYGGVTAGMQYDAIQHALFVGFVISMIFGHAPIIFPAVLGRPLAFQPAFYGHLVLLHASLLLRIGGDLAGWVAGRQWGGLLNVIALLLFLINTVRSTKTG